MILKRVNPLEKPGRAACTAMADNQRHANISCLRIGLKNCWKTMFDTKNKSFIFSWETLPNIRKNIHKKYWVNIRSLVKNHTLFLSINIDFGTVFTLWRHQWRNGIGYLPEIWIMTKQHQSPKSASTHIGRLGMTTKNGLNFEQKSWKGLGIFAFYEYSCWL